MDIKSLEKFGLTEGESRVYLALLKLGKSTIGNIIKEAGVSNSKIYNILDRLGKKGLVGVIIENNRRVFEAKSPSMLKDNLEEEEKELDEKRKELNEILPSLNEIFESHEVGQEAEILQGTKGIKTFVERMLEKTKKGETIYILGSPTEAGEKFNAYYLDWHKRRIEKGVNCKIIYNFNAKHYVETRKKMKMTQVRILPPELISPVAIDFNNEEVGILVFGKNPLCFSIRNVDIASNYKKHFEFLWINSN